MKQLSDAQPAQPSGQAAPCAASTNNGQMDDLSEDFPTDQSFGSITAECSLTTNKIQHQGHTSGKYDNAIDINVNDDDIDDSEDLRCGDDLLSIERKNRYEELIYRGVFSQYEHCSEQSIQYYTDAIELMPNEPEAYLRRALTYSSFSTENHSDDHSDVYVEKSQRDIERGLTVASNRLNELNCAPQVLHAHRRELEMEYMCLQALQLEMKYGDLDRAISLYEQILFMDPHHYFAYFSLGYLYDTKCNYSRALEYYYKSVACGPKFSPCIIYNNIGRCYELMLADEEEKRKEGNENENENGTTTGDAALDQQPNGNRSPQSTASHSITIVIHNSLDGEWIREELSTETCLKYYTMAIDSYAKCYLARQNRARLYEKMGRYEEAERDLQFILDRSPFHYIAMIRLADLKFYHLNQLAEAIQMMKRIQFVHCSRSYSFRIQAAYEHFITQDTDRSFQILDHALGTMVHRDEVQAVLLVKNHFLERMNRMEEADKVLFEANTWPETKYGTAMKRRLFSTLFRAGVPWFDISIVTTLE